MAQEQDIVLIYFEEQPLVFARIESILADSKPNWYHVKLLMLQVPLTVVTWILRDLYINGESFTMDGKQIRLERVFAPEPEVGSEAQNEPGPPERTRSPKPTGPKVISLADIKKT